MKQVIVVAVAIVVLIVSLFLKASLCHLKNIQNNHKQLFQNKLYLIQIENQD